MGLSGRHSHRQQEPEPTPQQQTDSASRDEAWPSTLSRGEQRKMVFLGLRKFKLEAKLELF
jgi:hypothetical protein